GGHVHFYNTIHRWDLLMPWRWFPRTHTKTLLIDSEIAYTGGVCMAERMRYWRDTHLRITGPVITQVRQAFDSIERKIQRRKVIKAPTTPQSGHQFSYCLSHPRRNRRFVYHELI